MPQFYQNDSIHTWFRVCLTEEAESLSEGAELSEWLFEVLMNEDSLAERCKEFLSHECVNENGNLARAILNTIDFTQLREDVLNDLKE